MDDITHPQLVAALAKPGKTIKDELLDSECHLWHMATGVAGEAGELIDAVKKIVIYRKAPDVQNIIEELGDMEFYLEAIRAHFGITREQVLEANINKLKIRYGKLKYSDEQAQARVDKA